MSRTYKRAPRRHQCERGTCDYCASNRTIQHKRALMAAAERALDNLMPAMVAAVQVAQAQVEREAPRCPVFGCPNPTVPHVHRDRFGMVAFEVPEPPEPEPLDVPEPWDDADEDAEQCEQCGGPAEPLGALGTTLHFRCRSCGWMQSRRAVDGR